MQGNAVKKVGDYFIMSRELGKGSFATVYLGYKDVPDNLFAIKCISKANFDDQKKKALLRETELLSGLKNQNIISLITVNETLNTIYLIMDYCSKGKLFDYLKDKPKTPELILKYTREIFSGFRYLYEKNIIHRDIKPDNLLLDSNGTLKIADFGFCKMLDEMDKEHNHTLLGTPLYACFEVISQKSYSSKCDVYSVAVVIFELAYGHHPLFPYTSPKSIADLYRRFKIQKE
jgi:serine/threonine protein kinase